ncbi:acyl-phosphate glycerol 3-phosphate acyltransferase [Aquaspirillum sp. LM1]|jgi:glycerol-3-phosphate acyltransferase PlsY|uniref:glycerol-3-phosphate 1-O-acyltransferase PlsY n=1 Tax=Aquaspirillum sp. LM1 TaxID=1938604 RepID=UPI0009839393|nr:glycerol-3-phosphate 1-O-acyltransferase PlsY [Aquaspirillum sp. LM1]AQR65292.1 acyl-phosphate glycerol 3-phosphate acyltransferase [Aquaspirillum sp. LM1]
MTTIAFIVAAYLIGSLSFAVIVSRAMGLADPRTFGSGNPGATNVLRTGKKTAAVLTLLGDGLKGWVAVMLAQWLGPRFGLAEPEVGMVALAVLFGHIWPLFFGFNGGKGVATGVGILAAFHPLLALGAVLIWALVAYTTKISSLAAIVAAFFSPFLAFWLCGPGVYFGATVVIALLLIQRHKKNILNLLTGNEGRIGQKASPSSSDGANSQ